MYHYRIQVPDHLVQIVAEGAVDLQSTKEILRTVIADAQFDPAFNFFVDVRQMAGAPSPDDLRHFADFLGAMRQVQGQFAVLTEAGVQFGLGRMLATLLSFRHIQMHVFLKEADAQQWLGKKLNV